MTTSLYLDKETKEKAALKAKKDKLSFSAVVRILISEYAQGKIAIGARSVPDYEISEVEIDNKTQKKMDSIVSKWHKKNE
jgi:predicted CopG family antitoxin